MNSGYHSYSLAPLAWLAGLLPLLTIHFCFVVSVSEGYIDTCLPYWESCSSISRAGRHGTAYFLFKGGMIPATVLMALFWWLNRYWLVWLGSDRGRALAWLGVIGSLCLLLYTLTLGHRSDTFHLLRRIGVMGYLATTYIAQVQIASVLRALPRWQRSGQWLIALSLLTLIIGLVSVILGAIYPDRYDDMEDAFEWWLVLLLNIHALSLAWLWQRSGFAMQPVPPGTG